jgi:hypothetical protein
MFAHSDPNLQDVYLRAMLEQFDQLANEDIEMQVGFPARSFPFDRYFMI